jgi:hypothetical protein
MAIQDSTAEPWVASLSVLAETQTTDVYAVPLSFAGPRATGRSVDLPSKGTPPAAVLWGSPRAYGRPLLRSARSPVHTDTRTQHAHASTR